MKCYICKTSISDEGQYVRKTAQNNGERICPQCGAEQWGLLPVGLRKEKYEYSENGIERVVYLHKQIDEEDYLISLGYGQGYQYYEAVIEDYKRGLLKCSWVEQDAGSRRFRQWKKESHEIYKHDYATIDKYLKEREELLAEIDSIERQKSIKWLFCSKRNAIDQKYEESRRIKAAIERIVSRIYK